MSALLKSAFRQSNLVTAMILLCALFIGAATPVYVGLMDGQLGKLAALPALLMMGLLLLYDRKLTLLLIIVLRASADNLLSFTRFSLGGYQIGIGGLINAAVIMIALILVVEKPKLLPKENVVPWSIFLVVAFVGIVPSPVKSEAIKAWLSLLSYFMVFASAFYFVRGRDDFKFCVKLVIWSSAVPVLYSFVDIALHHAGGGVDGFRLQSTFAHANALAFYLTLIISLVFYMLKSMPAAGNGAARVFLVAYLLLLAALLILTKTRSAWLACLLTFTLYAVFFERRYLLYLAGLLVVALFIPGVAERVSDLGQGNEAINYARLNSFAWRVYLWNSAAHWVEPKHYVFGNGLESFKEFSPIFFPLAGKVNWGAHSVFVQLTFELGLVGIGTYLWIYFKVLQQLKKLLKLDKLAAFFVIMVVVNFLICAFSDNMLDILSFNWYIWFIIGAGCAMTRLNADAPAKMRA